MARYLEAGANVCAFLDMIAVAEGTSCVPNSDDGYRVIVGGELFDDYSVHPNKRVWIPRINDYSTAAGRYQLLHRYFVPYANMLRLADFSPISQDKIAIRQIMESHALTSIQKGDIEEAISKCAHIWASLPGNNYQQRQVPKSELLAAYTNAGGTLA
jgi:muramidase (phage lysozyme)